MANPTNKTYFVRLERYNLKGKVVGVTDLYPSQIKQTMKMMKEYEDNGYQSIEEIEKGEA